MDYVLFPLGKEMSYLDDSVAQIEKFEGRVSWLYLDSKGNVTVGVGCMLPNVEAALQLPFMISGMGEDFSATPQQITEDFNSVSVMPANKLPTFYERASSIFLMDDEIDSLLLKTITTLDSALPRIYPAYPSWPIPAKLAALDMGYNLGLTKLANGYPHMNMYLNASRPNFIAASLQCARNSSDPAFNVRNLWTKNQFLEAA